MPKTYSSDDGEVGDLIAKLMKTEYRALAEAGVTVEVFMARNDTGDAVTLHGWPCQAVIKINNLENRTAGLADARMIVDANRWERKSAGERRGLVAHELHHLDLIRHKQGQVKKDDMDRPRLRMRKHDWELGGFDTIAERYEADAPEVQVAARIWKRLDQMEIDWTTAAMKEATVDTAEREPELVGV